MPTEWLSNTYVKIIKAQGFKTPRNPGIPKHVQNVSNWGGEFELPLSTPSILDPPRERYVVYKIFPWGTLGRNT